MTNKENNEHFQKVLKKHKQMINCIKTWDTKKDMTLMRYIKSSRLKLCLFWADFKCEYKDCGSEEDLIIHHLIHRWVKNFMDFKRYLLSRNYWNNAVILCKKHHGVVDGHTNSESMLTFDKRKIARIKKEFEKDEPTKKVKKVRKKEISK